MRVGVRQLTRNPNHLHLLPSRLGSNDRKMIRPLVSMYLARDISAFIRENFGKERIPS